MKRSMQLQVDAPCSQEWEGMQSAMGGRFCGSCQKTVIDFTQMSDADMLATITRLAGGCCGRFAAQQLERPLVLHPAHRVPFRMPTLPAAVVLASWLLLSLPDSLHAQQQKPVATQQVSCPPGVEQMIVGEVVPYTVISGCVKNGSRPIANATVLLGNTTRQTKTDANGCFKLEMAALLPDKAYLLVKAAPYANKKVVMDAQHPDKFLDIQLQDLRPMVMGKMTIKTTTKTVR
ncbi:hypothetical protein GA0116948_11282 [Chitinophaga costaii]|uniref:CarboxypepD_reg-like domain-containing protein n=1 Tax=Chitinophaga costaii TaxID=1335309 RepID=A0A1C4F8C9_9BACT|nr:carboxypeptidase-like regulatory domain-containing protein [Chitinophaga costaii]PUZ21209.1 carboxypeptidase regulatory-like domain-containing protein [Chitinophaga costaii]SCC51935.1 hypothetical protein GA0116948_11282 [Chitinophaga costaii]